ncbi:hypothetical protein ACN6LI_005894 [Streptomyces violaceoruber]
MTQRVGKLSQELAERLGSSGADSLIDVIVQLRSLEMSTAGSRKERIAAARQAFLDELGPVQEAIARANGEVVDTAWLNQTVRALVPARAVEELAAVPDVVRIMLPSRIKPDFEVSQD